MKHRLEIGIGGARETAQGFVETWKKVAKGKSPAEPEEQLYFEDLNVLLKVLSPQRWLLLRTLKKKGPSSIKALAKALDRDYKTVYTNTRLLESAGLVVRTDRNQVMVPWTTVIAEVRLAA
jgi:predicted transcriptional regulator